jgi:glycosyltransferase involved in cell wall biosynthesis
MISKKHITLLGQTPPPWHGQAVATQILFDHDWPGYNADRIRMNYSEEMDEVGRFQFKKLFRLLSLIKRTRRSLSRSNETILLYPPASAKWVPFLRDVLFLICVRGKAARTVFIFHASGLAQFTEGGAVRKWLAKLAYHGADMALEVAEEKIAPHRIYGAKQHLWCPCGIDVPDLPRKQREREGPLKVLFVGSLQEGKGILEILKTAALIRDRGHGVNFRFEIVGRWMDDEFEMETLALHKELDLAGIVEFPGQLTGNEKWEAYQNADVFFFPTHYASEATPIVLMEALGMGLPLVSTSWAGIPAMLKGCETATLLPVRSPERFAEALHSLFLSRDKCADIYEASKAFYQDNFLPAKFIERVEKACDQTVQPSSPISNLQSPKSKIQNPTSPLPSPLGDLGDLAVQPSSPAEETITNQDAGETPTLPSSSSKIHHPTSKISPSPLGDLGDLAVQPSSPAEETITNQDAGETPTLPSSLSKIHHPTSKISPSPLGDLGDLAVKPSSSSNIQHPTSKISLSIYLADQNPGQGRSLGISRMSKVILDEMATREDLGLKLLCTLSSQKGPERGAKKIILPWSTRPRIMRILTDQLHPVLAWFSASPDIWYFPKGFLPRFNLLKAPTVVTVHDTIIQYYQDHHPGWRKPIEYAYWKYMLTHTLKHADAIFTVSEISKKNIRSFMLRQDLPEKEILVTYEPCFYEQTPQPEDPAKKDYVVHLASREPHKHTHNLIRWWIARSESGENPPMLSLVGQVPPESEELIAAHPCIRRHDFLEDDELQTVIREARALILPSEIEGFGLPAIEAYYLGTPVCFVKGTSVEEILGESTSVGAFQLAEPDSLWKALDQVLAMPAADVRRIGLELRERFAAAKVVDRMIEGFRRVAVTSRSN